jgi:CRP-like cAMP-binding protein
VMNPCWVSVNNVSAASRATWRVGAEDAVRGESNSCSLRRLMKVWGMRRRVHASEPLFLPGDDTRYWYFVETGCLRVFAPGAERRASLAQLLGP